MRIIFLNIILITKILLNTIKEKNKKEISHKSENSNDTRIIDSDYILKNNYQKILLENYDETLSYVEQREEIKTIINKYMCYLNS